MVSHYIKHSFEAIEPVACPCGYSKRAFMEVEGKPATVHLLDVKQDTAPHYHRKMTEFYTILEGEGFLEIDGEMVPVKPMDTVMIPPGCVHRPVGRIRLLNFVIPGFDPEDEYVVHSSQTAQSG